MMWRTFEPMFRILICAAAFAAHFIFGGPAFAQDAIFRSGDGAVTVSGRFLDFDGEAATVLTEDGPITFRTDWMICEGDCSKFPKFAPTLRILAEGRAGTILLPALIEVFARDAGYSAEGEDGVWRLSRDDILEMSFEIETGAADESFEAFVNHEAHILISTRELSDGELEIARDRGLGQLDRARSARIIALDALVPVVAPGFGQHQILIEDLVDAMSGNGSDFDAYLPNPPDGQMLGFEERFMRPSGRTLGVQGDAAIPRSEVLESVLGAPRGLALVPFGQTGNAQPLALAGSCGLRSEARYLTLKTEDYPLTFPVYLYAPDRRLHPKVANFLDWLRSPAAQLVIRRSGFVDLGAVPIPLGLQGDRLSNAIANAGPEVTLSELQRMIRVLSPRVRMSSTFRFEPGSTRLDGQSRSNVMQLAQAIRDGRFAGREIMFVGFSDGRGPAVANRDLSSARAVAVLEDVRLAHGGAVPSNVSLETEAFGEALPMACDDTIWGQQTNRRVELSVRDLP